MGLFEFLMILISLVIGLGLTEILTGGANLLRARDKVQFYWVHTLFLVGIFFALFQQWWEAWEWFDIELIRFPQMLSLLASPIFLYLIAHLVIPRKVEGVDLEAYYFRQAPLLWGLVVAGTVVGNVIRPLVWGSPIFVLPNLTGVPMVAVGAVLAASKSRRVHAVVAPTVILLVVLDTVVFSPTLEGPPSGDCCQPVDSLQALTGL